MRLQEGREVCEVARGMADGVNRRHSDILFNTETREKQINFTAENAEFGEN